MYRNIPEAVKLIPIFSFVKNTALLLKEARLKAGTSLRARGDETGLAAGYLCNVENGNLPVGPAIMGRMLVVLSSEDAAELMAAYLQECAAEAITERDRLIREHGLRRDTRTLRVDATIRYSDDRAT